MTILLVCDRVDKHEAVIALVVSIPRSNEGVLTRSVHDLETDGLLVHHVVVLHVRVLDGRVIVVLELSIDNPHGDVGLANTSAPWNFQFSYNSLNYTLPISASFRNSVSVASAILIGDD